MLLQLEKRAEPSVLMALLSPIIAILLTLMTGALLFWALGIEPAQALYIYFIEPLTSDWSRDELAVKATPLVIIAIGLCIAYLSNTWNIGAEGQFIVGAVAGSTIPVLLPGFEGPLVLPLMLVFGFLGGAAWGFIPGILKTRFGANEILTSLMLVYVASLFLDWLVRGPWRDPGGFNFPESALFSASATVPALFDGRMHWGAVIAVALAFCVAILMGRTIKGFEIRTLGVAPRAGRFAGFSKNKMIIFAFMFSGGLAGLAGILEVAGTIGQLRPTISPGYGFTAIIVAFLGRLNPIGVLIAGLALALTYLGGEAAQIALNISDKTTRVFQGILLFYVLACDTFILNRFRFVRVNRERKASA